MKKIFFPILFALCLCACNDQNTPDYKVAYLSSVDIQKIPKDGYWGIEIYDGYGNVLGYSYMSMTRAMCTSGQVVFSYEDLRIYDEPYYFDINTTGDYATGVNDVYTTVLDKIYFSDFNMLKKLGFPISMRYVGDDIIVQFNYRYTE